MWRRTRGMALRGVRSADPPPLPDASDAPTTALRDLSGNADARTASAAAAAARLLAASDSLIWGGVGVPAAAVLPAMGQN